MPSKRCEIRLFVVINLKRSEIEGKHPLYSHFSILASPSHKRLNMKNITYLAFLFIVLGLSLGSCSEDQVEIDKELIKDYISENNIDAEEHPSGFFYRIIEEGTGDEQPNIFSEVRVKYKGYFLDDQ